MVLVEGVSDQVALETIAERRGRDLAAEGVGVVPMGGARSIGRYLERYGPGGLGLELAGLCDAGEEGEVRLGLERAGLRVGHGRAGLEAVGFYVCVADLEDELIRCLGAATVEGIIATQGELRSFRTLQRPELALGGDDAFHGGGAEAADQLVLQVGDAHVEPDRLQPGPAVADPEAGPLQPEPDLALLTGVTEAGQLEPEPAGTVPLQVAADAPGPAHGDHADALGGEVAAPALGDGLERDLVADPFDEHHGPNLVVHRASLVQPPGRVARPTSGA